jgi:hypothetical protein
MAQRFQLETVDHANAAISKLAIKNTPTIIKALHALNQIKELFEFLDYTEESDSGRIFHPITISSVRVMMSPKVEDLLLRMKATIAKIE